MLGNLKIPHTPRMYAERSRPSEMCNSFPLSMSVNIIHMSVYNMYDF